VTVTGHVDEVSDNAPKEGDGIEWKCGSAGHGSAGATPPSVDQLAQLVGTDPSWTLPGPDRFSPGELGEEL
jgi:hypothetical protein